MMPPAVVVHGRRGVNSEINGVYSMDESWHGLPCYRRNIGLNQATVYLCFADDEWRIGPSPGEGSVWAFASSRTASPLSIEAPWEVWDGKQLERDRRLRVSDTSVIPQVIFLFLDAAAPANLRALQGMLLQQPGLWDGRPYYQHQGFNNLFLLCSVQEGRWRLGPLPLGASESGDAGAPAALFARSAAALPQEITEVWHTENGGAEAAQALEHGSVKITTTGAQPPAFSAQYPRHIVVEGVAVGDGVANGVYRLSPELLNDRPVYHKTDAIRPSALWWFLGDWRLSPSVGHETVLAYTSSTAVSPLETTSFWQRMKDGGVESSVRMADATQAIANELDIAGYNYIQQPRLCDARPVYQRNPQHGDQKVYLFFRVHLNEWWLGPEVGGSECYFRAFGSRLHVAPDMAGLVWQPAAISAPQEQGVSDRHGDASLTQSSSHVTGLVASQWFGVLVSAALALVVGSLGLLGDHCTTRARAWSSLILSVGAADVARFTKSPQTVPLKAAPGLARRSFHPQCVVCLEGPCEILLNPCRHVCCCRECVDRLEHCPICREVKVSIAKVFLP
jgi:hypothetical protein